ncbi:MAG: pyruvate-formate lyase [Defluviitaleaceae bacterium]|nr:pyruvate-formate lyase [Defluviitaleaceae bacterium]
MESVRLSKEVVSRIAAMHDSKLIENSKKLHKFGGHYNTDDHGFIWFDDFNFSPVYPEGYDIMFGARCVGDNLKRFFSEIPAYIHPKSALAGAWPGFINRDFANVGLRPEDVPVHLHKTQDKYGIYSGIGGMNHLGPDMEIGFRLGYLGLLEKICYYEKRNAPASAEFYAGEKAVVEGILRYIDNHRVEAEKRVNETTDVWERTNYSEIAAVLKNLRTSPPKTFREACQFLAVFQAADRSYFAGGALQQLDELLRPFYENDKEQGILTDEDAIWMLASLFYNDTHYSQVGGQSPDGTKELTSPMSFLILQAAHELSIPYNLAVRVFEGSDDKLLRRALEYIMEKGTGACFSLSKGVEEGFIKQGHPAELARMRANVGCNWVALPGIEYPLQDVTRLNMGWVFHHALNDCMAETEPSLEKLWLHFSRHLKLAVECIAEGYDWHYEVVSRNTPELILNLFCHGPIERGLNSASGGVDIINLNVDGIALATVADSFGAIQQRVVEEKKLTWEEMYTTVCNNFANAEGIRLMLKNIPRFGHPESRALPWALRVRDEFVKLANQNPTPKHRLRVVPGMFSHGEIYEYGAKLPATPNGRFNGDPISHSNEPDPGFAADVISFSPTLKATAVAQAQPGMGNSAPLHLDIDTNMIKGAGGVDALVALIHTHNQMGGTRINLNCVTPEHIMAAHANPDAYPDLVVRVTGYSAFFSSLSKDYREQIIERYLRG